VTWEEALGRGLSLIVDGALEKELRAQAAHPS
jgi:hypothetical protein